jgi:hypothetical protein
MGKPPNKIWCDICGKEDEHFSTYSYEVPVTLKAKHNFDTWRQWTLEFCDDCWQGLVTVIDMYIKTHAKVHGHE